MDAAKELKHRTITVSNETQSRELRWPEFCFMWVGAKHRHELKRLHDELEETGSTTWTAGDGVVLKVTALDGWPKHEPR